MWPGLLARVAPWRGPALLVAGSVWDFATLRRVDAWLDNLLLVAYLAALGALLVVERRIALGRPVPAAVAARAGLVTMGTQFLLGGLFSAYLVYYSKSASFGRSLVFLALLAALLVTNELAEHALTVPRVRLPLYALVAATLLLVLLPVWTHRLVGLAVVGPLAVAAAVAVSALSGDPRREVASVAGASAALLLWMRLLAWSGLVPPVPLALAEAGAFHDVRREGDGYHLAYEDPGWRFWRDHDAVFRWTEGERVWVFSAVFAPTGMTLDVAHRWERWDPAEGWVETSTLDFEVTGGRAGGWRGYTNKRHVSPGAWRVLVVTGDGTEIGRVRFDVVAGPAGPLRERTY